MLSMGRGSVLQSRPWVLAASEGGVYVVEQYVIAKYHTATRPHELAATSGEELLSGWRPLQGDQFLPKIRVAPHR